MTRITVLSAFVAVAAMGAFVAAQPQAQRPTRDTPGQQPQTAAAAAPTGRISGRVLSAEGGRPVRRARVAINGSGLPGGRAALTDDSGLFDFNELPAGRYTVTASKTGYVSISYGQRRPLQAGTPLQLAEGQQLKDLDLRLPRGSVIAGHVFDDTGEPMPGTMVRVLMYRYAQGNRQLVPAGNGQTDDRGEYRVWGLNPGEYYVSATIRGLNINNLPPGRGAPVPPGGGRGFVLRGGPGGPDAAQLEAALAARGLAGFAGDLLGQDDPGQMAYAPTYYPGVPSPAEAQPVTVGLSAEVLGIDFNALLVRTGRVSGRVTNADGVPPSGGSVNLTPDIGVAGRGAALGGAYGSRIQDDGAFDIPSVPPGRYVLRATSDGGRGRGGRGRGGAAGSGELPQFASQPLSVDGDISGVLVTLVPGATLSGNITVQATQSALLPDVTQFRISAPPSDPSDAPFPQTQARVDQDGAFTLEGVSAGLHWIRAQTPRGWTLKSVVVDGRDVIDTPLDVRGAQRISGVSLVFTDKLSEINGTITDQAGAPVTEYTVLAFPTDAALWRPQARHIMTTRPDQNGKFQLRGLPPDDYFLAAVDPEVQGEWFEPAFLDQQRRGAVRISLGEGDVRTQDMRVTSR